MANNFRRSESSIPVGRSTPVNLHGNSDFGHELADVYYMRGIFFIEDISQLLKVGGANFLGLN